MMKFPENLRSPRLKYSTFDRRDVRPKSKPTRFIRCDCPCEPDLFRDATRGETICRQCGVVLVASEFVSSVPGKSREHPTRPKSDSIISRDLQRAFRLNLPSSKYGGRLRRGKHEILNLHRKFEFPDPVRDRAIFLFTKYLTYNPGCLSLQARARVCYYYAALEAQLPLSIPLLTSSHLGSTYLRQTYIDLLTTLHLPPVTTGWSIFLEELVAKLKLPGEVAATARLIMDRISAIPREQGCNPLGLVAGAVILGCRRFQILASTHIIATAAQLSPDLVRLAVKRIIGAIDLRQF